MRRYYEVRIISSSSISDLEEEMEAWANLRSKEADDDAMKGSDVVIHDHEYFKPASSISFVNGEYAVVMMRYFD